MNKLLNAQLSSTLSSQVTVTGEMQKGVFISNISEVQGVTINTYFSTVVLDRQYDIILKLRRTQATNKICFKYR